MPKVLADVFTAGCIIARARIVGITAIGRQPAIKARCTDFGPRTAFTLALACYTHAITAVHPALTLAGVYTQALFTDDLSDTSTLNAAEP